MISWVALFEDFIKERQVQQQQQQCRLFGLYRTISFTKFSAAVALIAFDAFFSRRRTQPWVWVFCYKMLLEIVVTLIVLLALQVVCCISFELHFKRNVKLTFSILIIKWNKCCNIVYNFFPKFINFQDNSCAWIESGTHLYSSINRCDDPNDASVHAVENQ